MKANEFRLGIWVSHNGNDILCDEGFLEVLFETKNYEVFEPKPLTEEWLLKFGFEQDNKYFKKDSPDESIHLTIRISLPNQKLNIEDDYYDSIDIKMPEFVHELQNLYFALTGTELTIK